MKKPIIAALVVVIVLAGALIYWQRSKRAPDPEPVPETAQTTKRKAGQHHAASAEGGGMPGEPELALDDDPRGHLRLEGQVIDADDAPVAGAVVTISANPPRVATSEDDGSFSFDGLVPRVYSLTAHKDDFAGGPVMHELTAASEPVAIRMAIGATVDVAVVTDNGEPIAGASVELRDGVPRTETTGADGKARFRGVSGGFAVLVASAPGFGTAHQPVPVPEAAGARIDARVVLRKGAVASGKVVDQSGKPIAGARVLARDASDFIARLDARRDGVLTDAKGEFTTAPLVAGSYRFTAMHGEHAPGSSSLMSLDGVTEMRGIVIELQAGGVLAGKVVDAQGQPVPYATVRVGPGTGRPGLMGEGNDRVRQATADEHGTFTINGLARAELAAIAMSDTASSEIAEVDLRARPKKTDLVLTLVITGTIAGVVVDSAGEPVPEAQVSALPDFWGGDTLDDFALRGMAAEITDGGGKFAFRGLRPGNYRVRASRSKLRIMEFATPGVQAATGDTNVRLVLDAPGSITGKLALDDGSVPEVFSVVVGFPPGVPVASSDGSFIVDSVPPGRYDVSLRGPSFATHKIPDVVIEPGKTRDLGTITARRGRHVSGRVLDAGGNPVAGAAVLAGAFLMGDGKSLSSNPNFGDELTGARRTTTDDDGRFRIDGVARTELQIVAEHEQKGRSLPSLIPAGVTSPAFDLVLQPYGRVVGTVKAGGEPARGALITASPAGAAKQMVMVKAGDDGSYVLEHLPEGKHRITAQIGSMGTSNAGGADVEVVGGREVRADIDIELGDIELAVLVTGKDGARIDAVQAFLLPKGVSPRTGKEIMQVYMQLSDSGALSTIATSGVPAVFKQIRAAEYSICVIPINGDLNDASFAIRLQEHAEHLKVYCEPKAVSATPAQQSHAMEVPPMDPLPAPQASE